MEEKRRKKMNTKKIIRTDNIVYYNILITRMCIGREIGPFTCWIIFGRNMKSQPKHLDLLLLLLLFEGI